MAKKTTLVRLTRTRWSPIIVGAVCALLSGLAVTVVTAAFISITGNYPNNARQLELALSNLEVTRGSAEKVEAGVRLNPGRDGTVVVLFDDAPRFLADQFLNVEVRAAGTERVRRAEWVWVSRANLEDTRLSAMRVTSKGMITTLGKSPGWQGRIDGVGLVIAAASPVTLNRVRLSPPNPTITYLLNRIWSEWTFREEYQGYTINGLEGAGPATLVPLGLSGGLALILAAGGIWAVSLLGLKDSKESGPTLLAAAIALWIMVELPWLREVWAEAAWSVDTYAGKSDSQKRLIQPDANLYDLALHVKDAVPAPPQRIFVIGTGRDAPSSTNFERSKIHYYLAPHNVLSRFKKLPAPRRGAVHPGDYVLVLDRDQESYALNDGEIAPGYPARLIFEYRNARLFEVISDATR